MAESTEPWVEKYRPDTLEDIVLDSTNKTIIKNIIENQTFPNLLFYGPPGTGKTTTILNLIRDYQKNTSGVNKSLVIHLNASDERGIDTIRNVISEFTSTNGLFKNGIKFVILDEVDSMTKNAQLALKILIQKTRTSTRFCLITNYLSRVDVSLRNYCVSMRFNQLPVSNIIDTLTKINIKENIGLDNNQLETIQKKYCSDMRSMINYMQMIQVNMQAVITDNILEKMTKNLKNKTTNDMLHLFDSIVLSYNTNIIEIIKTYFTYIIRNHKKYVTNDMLVFIEKLLHCNCQSPALLKRYFIIHMKKLLS
tara:strand:- start:7 stop:933 length:927 start_codon:yes stop_codon:yes gene_type:complete